MDTLKISKIKTQFMQKVIIMGRKSSLIKQFNRISTNTALSPKNVTRKNTTNTVVANQVSERKKISTNNLLVNQPSVNAKTQDLNRNSTNLKPIGETNGENMLLEEHTITKFPKYSRSITIGKKIYSLGGEDNSGVVNYFLEIDPENDYFVKTLKPMTSNRAGANLFNLNDKKLFVISGAYEEKSCEYYDLENNKWVRLNAVIKPRVGAVLVFVNKIDLFMFFGKHWNKYKRCWDFIDVVERLKLHADNNKWEEIDFKFENIDLQIKRSFSGSIIGLDNTILVFGGQTASEEGKVCDTNKSIKIDFDKLKILEGSFCLPLPYKFLNPSFYINNLVNVNFDVEGNAHFYSNVHENHWIIYSK